MCKIFCILIRLTEIYNAQYTNLINKSKKNNRHGTHLKYTFKCDIRLTGN